MNRTTTALIFAAALGCGGTERDPADDGPGTPTGFQPPVVTNADSPVVYPTDLYDRGVEGSVVLRLFVDESGRVVPDSTSIAEGSGYPALDSAALAGVSTMQFAPATQDDQPIATGFLQPIHFRHPDGTTSNGPQ